MKRMTVDELLKLTGGNPSGGSPPQKPYNKYRNKKVGKHASKKEHKRAGELKLMQFAGEISNLREQVTYELLPAQKDKDGNLLENKLSYRADFVYYDKKGNLVVEDAKGYRTEVYKIKRKLMLFIHGIRIKET